MRTYIKIVDHLNDVLGRSTGWLMLGLVLLVTVDVISRYLFNTGLVIIQELEWWLFSIIFLIAAGYTLISDGHVRVDLIYSLLSKRKKNYIDLFGAFVFLLPMCALIIVTSQGFVAYSWSVGEYSPDPGGMPAYYVLKAIIPIGFFLLALQGISQVFKIVIELRSESAVGAESGGEDQ